MSTIIESTTPDQQQLRRRLPPDLYQRNNALLDELERARLELKRRQAVDDAKTRHMRGVRTAWIEAHVEDVIRSKKPALVDKSRCKWTGILMRFYERHGIAAPDIETVRRVVKEFNGF